MTLTLTLELTDEQADKIRGLPDSWNERCAASGVPWWVYYSIPLMQGYDWKFQITDLGKQARAKLLEAE